MELFEYAVVLKKKDEEAKIIVPVTQVMAKDKDHAEKIAIRAISTVYEEDVKDCEVLVRPFV